MQRELNPQTGDYTDKSICTLQNAIYIRLKTPKGSYWADPELGSLLHLLEREKDLKRVGMIAKQYAEEALEPLLKMGRADHIEVSPQQEVGGLILFIQVQTAQGGFDYRHFVPIV